MQWNTPDLHFFKLELPCDPIGGGHPYHKLSHSQLQKLMVEIDSEQRSLDLRFKPSGRFQSPTDLEPQQALASLGMTTTLPTYQGTT